MATEKSIKFTECPICGKDIKIGENCADTKDWQHRQWRRECTKILEGHSDSA